VADLDMAFWLHRRPPSGAPTPGVFREEDAPRASDLLPVTT